MASTANLLRLRPKFPGIPNPSFTRFFSSTPSDNEDNHIFSSTPSDNDDESNPSPPQSKSSLSSYFSDVKSSLKKPSHSPNSSPPPKPSNDSSTTNTDAPNSPSKAATLEDIRKNLSEYRSRAAADDDGNKPSKDSSTTNTGAPNSPSKAATLEEIRKNLSEYRSRTAAPPSSDDDGNKPSFSQSQPISFQDIYKRSLIDKDKGNNNNTTTNPNQQPSGTFGFDAIKSSLSRLKSSVTNQAGGGQVNSSASFSRFTDSLKHKGMDPNPNPNAKGASLVIGGSGTLPLSVFGNELRDKNAASDNDNEDPKTTDFLTNYSYPELGEKLRLLRPENKGKNWFTLTELNERLIQLRKYEIKENRRRGGAYFNDLRSSIVQLGKVEDDKKRSATMQRLSLLGKMGGVETRSHNDTLSTPKEHLIENYFHPDNMSSAEKLKVELTKVRDEFKMSESDCGSSRVQVALLTTKIKHLSTALHKKDKHSRKGLMAMIQRRKKLLKYLRRTDWVSYCLVLSKLGLRDNPDYKA